MKISCQIIEDLLPLYYDKVCSNDSKSLVEEHINECENCKNKLILIEEEVKSPQIASTEIDSIKKIASTLKKGNKKSFIKGSIIALLIFLILICGYIGLTQIKFIPVKSNLIEISEVSRLENGIIIYHLNIKDDKNLHFIKFSLTDDGTYYITPMRSIIESKRVSNAGLFNEYYLFDIDENNAYEKEHGKGINISACYIGTPEDNILLWKEGIELPKASQELEKLMDNKLNK